MISDFWSIPIANAILAAASGIIWMGARSFEGRRTSVPLALAGTIRAASGASNATR